MRHHVWNGFMWMRLQCQSDLVITSPWEKRGIQKPSWFANTKVYSQLQILVVDGERETEFKNWVDCVCLSKRNNMSWGEKADTDRIIFPIFFCSSITCFFAGSILTAARQSRNCCLYIVVPQPTELFFPVSYPASTALRHFHFSSLQLMRASCRFAAHTFVLLTRASWIILYFWLRFFQSWKFLHAGRIYNMLPVFPADIFNPLLRD